MPNIFPYKAIICNNSEIAKDICIKNPNLLSAKEKKQLIENKLSFYNALYPQKNIDDNEEKMYYIKNYIETLHTNNKLHKKEKEILLIYKQKHKDYQHIGIISNISLLDYEKNIVKKHENVLKSRVSLFVEYLEKVGYNSEPVLLTYNTNQEISSIMENKINNNLPSLQFTKENIIHEIWPIEDDEEIKNLQLEFQKINSFYIADGHHRIASSYNLYSKNNSKSMVLSYMVDSSNLRIWDFNRIIKNIEINEKEFLDKISNDFEIINSSKSILYPSEKYEFVFIISNIWYKIKLKNIENLPKDIIYHIDSNILSDKILSDILNIKDISNDERVSFFAKTEDINIELKKLISGEINIIILLYPSNFDELKQISDENKIMPPKTTWIEPKIPTGLFFSEI